MTRAARSLAFVTLTSVAACVGGCKHDAPASATQAAAAPASASAAPRTVDQLAPGELAESSDRAFGLALPRGLRVERRFGDLVAARGRVPPMAVMSYVKKRVDCAMPEFGLTSGRFPDAHVQGTSLDARVRIEVTQVDDATELVVRDTTPPHVDPTVDEAEKLRRSGLRPDGKQLDTTKLR